MRKWGTGLLAVGVLLLFLSASLFLHYRMSDQRAGEEVSHLASLMEPLIPEKSQAPTWDDGLVTASPKALEIEGQSYIGLLEIPSLNQKLPLLRSALGSGSKEMPYRLQGRAETDNLVLYGYRYSSLFGGLKNLPAESLLSFVDLDGYVYDYQITDQARIYSLEGFLETSVLQGLILVTPALSGYQVIFCHRIS